MAIPILPLAPVDRDSLGGAIDAAVDLVVMTHIIIRTPFGRREQLL